MGSKRELKKRFEDLREQDGEPKSLDLLILEEFCGDGQGVDREDDREAENGE